MTGDEASNADELINRHDPYAALRHPNFRWFVSGNFLSIGGLQMQTFAISWEIYERTRDTLALAYVGLVQVAPVVLLAMFAGHVADRFNRRRVIQTALLAIAASSVGLGVVSILQGPIYLIYVCLFVAGIARAFQQPAKASLLPQLVPRSIYTNAVTWNSTNFQLAAMAGPAMGGLLIWLTQRAAVVYWCDAAAAISFFFFLSQIRYEAHVPVRQPLSVASLLAGARFVRQNKVILGASGLDMVAVLLGGAVAMLPVYAKEILAVGPGGLGMMQAAPAIGAMCMTFVLAHRPPTKRAGRAMLLSVAAFGLVTVGFGVSRWFALSLAMLLLVGATDAISVVIRHSLIQLLTPDEMRGRVSAINGMFISISNEISRFRAGFIAWAFTGVATIPVAATISVVGGGVGTVAVVAGAALLFPELRRYGRLGGMSPETAPPADVLEPSRDQTELADSLPP